MMVWLLLLAASAGVFLHAGIKFPWFVFFQKDSGLRPKDPPWNMRAAMVLLAVACIFLGVFPEWLYRLLPYPVDYVPYTASHLVTQLQLLLFSGLAFFALLPLMKRTLTISLDFDWVYRRLILSLMNRLICLLSCLDTALRSAFSRIFSIIWTYIGRHHGPEGMLARTWPTGSVVTWVVVLLTVFLLFSIY